MLNIKELVLGNCSYTFQNCLVKLTLKNIEHELTPVELKEYTILKERRVIFLVLCELLIVILKKLYLCKIDEM